MILWFAMPAVTFLCFSAGRLCITRWRITMEKDEQVLFGTAVGMGMLSYGVLLLGLMGQLRLVSLCGLLIVLLIMSAMNWGHSWAALKRAVALWEPKAHPWNTAIFLGSGLCLATAFLGVLAPETTNDSLCYHLHLPKLFLVSGTIGPIPYEVNSLFPFFMEMLYTAGLTVGGEALSKYFHFLTGILAAMAVLVYARRYTSRVYAWWAALLFLTTPGIINQLSTTYVDVGLTCYGVLALYGYLRWRETRETSWAVLAGMCAGFMLSIKYLALIACLGMGLLLIYELIRRRQLLRGLISVIPWFLIPMCLCAGYWYVRAYVELGNPVYPYFYSIFKAGDPTIHYNDIGVSKNILSFVAVPWLMTMRPDIFEGFGVQIGPGYLAFLPLAFMSRSKIPNAGSLAFFSLFYLVCWFFLGQSLRFLYPILPVLAMLMAGGFAYSSSLGNVGRWVPAMVAAVIWIHAGVAFYHHRSIYQVALGLESGTEYLSKRERSFDVAQWVNKNLDADSRIMNVDETHMYHFERPIVREIVYAGRTEYYEGAESAADVVRRLLADGFTHILDVSRPSDGSHSGQSPFRLPRLLREGQKELALHLDLLYTHAFREDSGEAVRYRLYYLNPSI
ncbi:MAG: phospholipid carrier-dependent glycosyltransferase [Candidatus Omnitrophota bacterium]|nr:phospholipid carrier-dependent glycosyltransferase [Candidatus Omnitrophota bacterium]